MGQWIRLYALAPSPARRRLHAAPANASLVEDEPGYLPLTPALRRQAVQARQYAASEAAPEGVTSAAQPGTLDAYLCECGMAAGCFGAHTVQGECMGRQTQAALLPTVSACCDFAYAWLSSGYCAAESRLNLNNGIISIMVCRWRKSCRLWEECVRRHRPHPLPRTVSRVPRVCCCTAPRARQEALAVPHLPFPNGVFAGWWPKGATGSSWRGPCRMKFAPSGTLLFTSFTQRSSTWAWRA